jgi:peptidoglycan/xylan/chitin deacetylase (PgdA/CDA1 family)
MTGVMWTVIGRDWVLSAHEIAEQVVSAASNGAIICLHDGRVLHPAPDISNTIRAVRKIVPRLRDGGFEFRTVSNLVG